MRTEKRPFTKGKKGIGKRQGDVPILPIAIIILVTIMSLVFIAQMR